MKKVLVFGVFDGVHDGHRALFRQAKALGDHLTVAAAQDEIVAQLKGKLPFHTIDARMELIDAEPDVDAVIPGDAILGTYEVVFRTRPHIIALGYDQRALREDLSSKLNGLGVESEIVVLAAHRPEELHNSLLHPQN